MPRARRQPPKGIDPRVIQDILGELDSLLGGFDNEDLETVGYRLDALTTLFLKARLVKARLISRERVRRLKFHVVIEEVAIELPERDALAEAMETFEDLINAYGDEPSHEELDEAKEILERVVEALKGAFQRSQLRLDLGR
jgi:cellulose biosynthesis protein BcsQ